MMASVNTYESLYRSMKEHFTVVSAGGEYTLGAYMRKKARESRGQSDLPITVTRAVRPAPVRALVSYVSDKLAVHNPPPPEKVIRRFPLRTSLAAFGSALMICVFVFSLGLFSRQTLKASPFSASGTIHSESFVTEEKEMTKPVAKNAD